jgi:hypothetical protein
MGVPKELMIQPDRSSVRPNEVKNYDRVVMRQTSYGYAKGTPGYDLRLKGQEAGPYFGVLLQAPPVADHISELGAYYRSRGEEPNSYKHKDREWVDVVLGEHLGFNMWGHLIDGIAVGIRPDAILAVLDHDWEALTEEERLFARYIKRFADGQLDAADWEWVQSKLGTRGAVEYTALIGHLTMTIRLIQAFMSNHAESNQETAAKLREFIASGQPLPDPSARVPRYELEDSAA